ncbi:hypothetical protein Xedl_00180 [Xenorhabdus eapokensis]|uniref:Uncharacterized protein n=1 Tax=Xenorhabdus eapokensis TaxID=1873482 RepID=A0A1Q5TZR1_9GAMM|nr:hypothetical protein Xedl_00180 [Xenorhabdus eapokensis]
MPETQSTFCQRKQNSGDSKSYKYFRITLLFSRLFLPKFTLLWNEF